SVPVLPQVAAFHLIMTGRFCVIPDTIRSSCGTGCPAAVVARGGRIGDLDDEICPVGKSG
ncbi:MAG: hypothetical protein ACREJM_07745, partial [Candidatus Saccharimonadales bacterium]